MSISQPPMPYVALANCLTGRLRKQPSGYVTALPASRNVFLKIFFSSATRLDLIRFQNVTVIYLSSRLYNAFFLLISAVPLKIAGNKYYVLYLKPSFCVFFIFVFLICHLFSLNVFSLLLSSASSVARSKYLRWRKNRSRRL
jgi:hypothetical protein